MDSLILTNTKNRRDSLICSVVGVVMSIFLVGGCVAPPALRSTVIGYDKTTNQLE